MKTPNLWAESPPQERMKLEGVCSHCGEYFTRYVSPKFTGQPICRPCDLKYQKKRRGRTGKQLDKLHGGQPVKMLSRREINRIAKTLTPPPGIAGLRYVKG